MRRLREWAQARLEAAILPVVQRCVRDAAVPIDYGRLRDDIGESIAERVIEQIDKSRIAEQIADTISVEDVAYYIDAEDVAGHVDVDTDDIASKVAEEIDVSECVDYDKLAEALVSKLKEAWA
jgi:SAM-dependent MidA family methyltransferase